MAQHQENYQERPNDGFTPEQLAELRRLAPTLIREFYSDRDNCAWVLDRTLAPVHEAFGRFLVKKVLQIGGAVVVALAAILAAKGYVKL